MGIRDQRFKFLFVASLCALLRSGALASTEASVVCIGSDDSLNVVFAEAPSPPCRPLPTPTVELPYGSKRAALIFTPPNTITIGTIDPSGQSLFHPAALQPVLLHLPQPRPVDLTLEFKPHDGSGRWVITPPRTPAPLRVMLPHGEWTVSATAARHRPWTAKVVIPRSQTEPLRLTLAKIPTVKGQVLVDATDAGAAGALITNDAGKVLTVADFWGHFEFIEDPRPQRLHIEYSGFGSELLHLPDGDADYTLPVVRLKKHGSLMVRLDVPEGFSFPRNPTFIVERQEAGYRWDENVRGTVDPQQLVWRVPNLKPGSYRVVVKGDEPLERLLKTADVLSGSESEIRLGVKPSVVEVQVRMAKTPLQAARLTVSGDWDATVTTGEDGFVASRAWDTGTFLVTVEHAGLTIPFATTKRILTRAEEWSISIPSSTLSGTVRSKDGKAIAGARVVVKGESTGVSFFMPTVTDVDGQFEFTGLSGTAVLSCEADGFRPSELVTAHVMPEQEHHVSIVLSRGKQTLVRVTRTHGPGRAGASVLALVGQQVVSEGVTLPGGTALLTLPEDRQGTVFVIEADGGFGFTHFTPDHVRTGDDLSVVLAPLTSQLRLSVREAESREPVPRLPFSLRYNFTAIPPVVLAMIEHAQRKQFSTDLRGELLLTNLPSGFYELIPGARADATHFLPAEAVALELTGGSQSVDILVKRARRP